MMTTSRWISYKRLAITLSALDQLFDYFNYSLQYNHGRQKQLIRSNFLDKS